jgi:hypothetical protein
MPPLCYTNGGKYYIFHRHSSSSAVRSLLYVFSFMQKIAGDGCYDGEHYKKVKWAAQVIRKKSNQPDQQTAGSKRVDQVFHRVVVIFFSLL